MRFTKINKEQEKDEKAESDASALAELLGPPPKDIRTMGLFGDVDEEKAGDVLMGLLLLTDLSGKEAPYEPITLYISTYGGSADEMFGIYDMMTKVKAQCEVHTIGIGKVMSAGTLILAAGTKGKRKIGKHCRVMIHSVNAGQVGDLHSIENMRFVRGKSVQGKSITVPRCTEHETKSW